MSELGPDDVNDTLIGAVQPVKRDAELAAIVFEGVDLGLGRSRQQWEAPGSRSARYDPSSRRSDPDGELSARSVASPSNAWGEVTS